MSALGRLEIKDFVDLWTLAKNRSFSWQEIFSEAKQKDAGLDPVMAYELLRTIPADSLELIKWTLSIDSKSFFRDMQQIADDLLKGNDNSLVRIQS